MSQANVLIVDDDSLNRELLKEFVEEAGLEVTLAEDGLSGWNKLDLHPEKFQAILLDRVMPGMDGIAVLQRIKQDPRLHALPVIMQTSMSSKTEIAEGLVAGAYYYMTKPLDCTVVQAVVRTAVADYQRYRDAQLAAQRTSKTLTTMQSGHFRFRTLQQAQDLASMLSQACPASERVVIGLMELLVNAVEHGNLGIGYDEKTRLNEDGTWVQEVEQRLKLPEHAQKAVEVSFERGESEIRILVRDDGQGFDWQNYMEFSPDRAFDNHGRGIAMAKSLSFDRIEYRGRGNEVLATLKL